MNKDICLETLEILNKFENLRWKIQKKSMIECMNIFVALKSNKNFVQINIYVRKYLICWIFEYVWHTGMENPLHSLFRNRFLVNN